MLKPRHKRALVDILMSEDFDSPEDMVKAVVSTLDDLRADDTTYMVVREWSPMFFGYGPYPTRNAAQKAIEKGLTGIPGTGKVAIVPTFSQKRVEQRIAEADDFPAVHKAHFSMVREKVGVA